MNLINSNGLIHMEFINHSCQGESHKANNKICQDYSLSLSDPDTRSTIAVVCDGHGGDTYFRSAIGAKFAAEITAKKTIQFLNETNLSVLANCPPLQMGIFEDNGHNNRMEVDAVMRRLFTSIYAEWRTSIERDAKREPTKWEIDNVKEQYIELLKDEENLVKIYGCTLMAFVYTPSFWFGFHIGDGKFVIVNQEYEMIQPIPWDERCFLNKTTSLCGNEPQNDFRYCINVDSHSPVAVFMGSDGIDDTYGDGDKLYAFYGDIMKELAINGKNSVLQSLKEDLPILSKLGSQDDMSIAIVYDESKIAKAAMVINSFQKCNLEREIKELESRIQLKKETIQRYNDLLENYNNAVSELPIVEKELARDNEDLRKLNDKLLTIASFHVPENYQ